MVYTYTYKILKLISVLLLSSIPSFTLSIHILFQPLFNFPARK